MKVAGGRGPSGPKRIEAETPSIGPPPSPGSAAEVRREGALPKASPAERASAKLDLAERYAAAGKPRLAARRLSEAKALLAAPSDAGGLHPGMWKPGALDARLAKAEAAVKAAAVARVGEGRVSTKETVMLFGLSANPPTGEGGHMGLVRWGAERLKVDFPDDAQPARAEEQVPVDQVWVLPVYKHIYATKGNLAPFPDRFAMARLAFEAMPGLEGRIAVKDTERTVIEGALAKAIEAGQDPKTVRVGTIDVVRHLQAEHPDKRFVLVLGGDTYQDLLAGKWKESETLLELLPIVALPRAGIPPTEATVTDGPKLTDISSTKVRASTDEAFLTEALHPAVLDYLKTKKLYAFAEGEVT